MINVVKVATPSKEIRTMMRYNYLGGAAIGALLLTVGGHSARAEPSYAFANLLFTNFTLTGVVSAPGVTVTSATVTTSDSAGYATSPGAVNSIGGSLTGGSDVTQAFSGPGPAPGQNVFTPALSALSGARGDAQIFGSISSGTATSGDVSEGRLTLDSSTASSSSGTTTGINIDIVVTVPTTIKLSFNASDFLTSTTAASDDGASSQTNASFTVTGSGGENFTYAPAALNEATSASGAGGLQTITNPLAFYSTTVSLGTGTFQISLLSGTQERLQTGAPVPEPVSTAILGAGLMGLAGVVRRRRKI
jgi:hypothetical protein